MMSERKIIYFKATTANEINKYLSELLISEYNIGDKAVVTFPDGSKAAYSLKKTWISKNGSDKIKLDKE